MRIESKAAKALAGPILAFAGLFLPAYTGSTAFDPAALMNPSALLGGALAMAGQTALLVFIIDMTKGLPECGIRAPDRRSPLKAIAPAATLVCLLFLFSLVANPRDMALVNLGRPTAPAWLLAPAILISALATGYREELFFRAYLYQGLGEAGAGRWGSIAMASILFGLGHGWEGWNGIILTCAFGFSLGYFFSKDKDIHAVAWAHAFYNASVLAIRAFAS